MRFSFPFAVIAAAFLSLSLQAEALIGSSAPAFELKDPSGKTHKLSDYKGKTVILEWVNYGCPFVRKHYDSGNMQKLQASYNSGNFVWLSVCSSAEGKEGYISAKELPSKIAAEKSKANAYLIDADGTAGKLYGAKTTPHMYIISKEGKLVYKGAIDSVRSTDAADVDKAEKYIADALAAIKAGKPVVKTETTAYGCSVKYKN